MTTKERQRHYARQGKMQGKRQRCCRDYCDALMANVFIDHEDEWFII